MLFVGSCIVGFVVGCVIGRGGRFGPGVDYIVGGGITLLGVFLSTYLIPKFSEDRRSRAALKAFGAELYLNAAYLRLLRPWAASGRYRFTTKRLEAALELPVVTTDAKLYASAALLKEQFDNLERFWKLVAGNWSKLSPSDQERAKREYEGRPLQSTLHELEDTLRLFEERFRLRVPRIDVSLAARIRDDWDTKGL
jgi:hypothetical protein